MEHKKKMRSKFEQMRIVPLVLAMALILGPLPALGQRVEDDSQHPAVQRFVRQMAGMKSLRARVAVTVENQPRGQTQTFRGEIEAQGEGYRFRGMGMEIWSDGTTQWQFLPEVNEVTIYPLGTGPLDRPMDLFRDLSARFKIRYRGLRKEGANTFHDLSLYPRDVHVGFSQIHLSAREPDLRPGQVTYVGKDGIHYKIEFQTFERNAEIQGHFTFNTQRKGLEVIDLR